MNHDDRGEREENRVIDAESDFVPLIERPCDHLGNGVLHDQDEPYPAVSVGKRIAARVARPRPAKDRISDREEAGDEDRQGAPPEQPVPVVLIAPRVEMLPEELRPILVFFLAVNIEPAFQSVADRKAKTREQAEIQAQPLNIGIAVGGCRELLFFVKRCAIEEIPQEPDRHGNAGEKRTVSKQGSRRRKMVGQICRQETDDRGGGETDDDCDGHEECHPFDAARLTK